MLFSKIATSQGWFIGILVNIVFTNASFISFAWIREVKNLPKDCKSQFNLDQIDTIVKKYCLEKSSNISCLHITKMQ